MIKTHKRGGFYISTNDHRSKELLKVTSLIEVSTLATNLKSLDSQQIMPFYDCLTEDTPPPSFLCLIIISKLIWPLRIFFFYSGRVHIKVMSNTKCNFPQVQLLKAGVSDGLNLFKRVRCPNFRHFSLPLLSVSVIQQLMYQLYDKLSFHVLYNYNVNRCVKEVSSNIS